MRTLFLLLLLLVAAPAWAIDIGAMPDTNAYNPDLGSIDVNVRGECRVFTADGVIANNAGRLISVTITNASANDDVLIYDNASAASGTVIANFLNVAAGATVIPNFPANFANGAFLDLTTAAAMNVNVCWNE